MALNLVSMGLFFDIAVRDVVLAFGAFTLARLTLVRTAARPATERPHAVVHRQPASV